MSNEWCDRCGCHWKMHVSLPSTAADNTEAAAPTPCHSYGCRCETFRGPGAVPAPPAAAPVVAPGEPHRCEFADEVEKLREQVRDLVHGDLKTFKTTAADALADEVDVLVRRKVIDPRSPAADALLSYRDPPTTERSSRIAALEARATAAESRLAAIATLVNAYVNGDEPEGAPSARRVVLAIAEILGGAK